MKNLEIEIPDDELIPERLVWQIGDVEDAGDDEDDDDLYDMTETLELPEWGDIIAWEFAEWFGYTIEPNPDSSLGFRVTSPSGKTLGGKTLGGAVARRIIEASQKNPDTGTGTKPGKGKKGGGKGKAKPKVDPAVALAEAKTKAQEAFDKIDPIGLEDKSGGVLRSSDIDAMLKTAQDKLAGAKDAKEARAIVAQFKKDMAAYKNELMPKPTAQQARELAVRKIADSLPSPEELAGDKYDPAALKQITAKYDVAGARSPEKARELVKEMRAEVAAYKKEAAAKAKAAKQEAASIKKQAKDSASLQLAARANGWETVEVIKGSPADMEAYREKVLELAKNNPDKQYTVIRARDGSFGLLEKPNAALTATPSANPAKEPNLVGAIPEPNIKREPVTASEWAAYYVDVMAEEPEQFAAVGQPRDSHGKWTKGAGGSTVEGLEAKVAGGAAHNTFRDNYFGSDKSFHANEYLRHGTERGLGKVNSAKLMKAADKASVELPEAMEVQRSIRFRDGVPAEFRKGAVITDKGFTSTTTSKEWAEYHARGKGITLTITLPKGTKVIPNSKEHELVLKPPSKYKITGKSGKNFTAELIP